MVSHLSPIKTLALIVSLLLLQGFSTNKTSTITGDLTVNGEITADKITLKTSSGKNFSILNHAYGADLVWVLPDNDTEAKKGHFLILDKQDYDTSNNKYTLTLKWSTPNDFAKLNPDSFSLEDYSILEEHIAKDAITGKVIKRGAIKSEHIQDKQITADHLHEDFKVTSDMIESIDASKITGSILITNTKIDGNDIEGPISMAKLDSKIAPFPNGLIALVKEVDDAPYGWQYCADHFSNPPNYNKVTDVVYPTMEGFTCLVKIDGT